MQRINRDKLLKSVEGSDGVLSEIARRNGVSRQRIHKLVQVDEELAALVYHEKEGAKDRAEIELLTKVRTGNIRAIMFYLKTQAKDRGYVERQEIINDTALLKQLADTAQAQGIDIEKLLTGMLHELQRSTEAGNGNN